jgi:membrane protein implicated in regulation of membrane protease activity
MEFWEGLLLAQKIYFCVGLAASVFLILQIITLLFGIGDSGEVDIDLSGDGEVDATVDLSDGFTLFSLRGIVAFFAIGGWTGYALAPINTWIAVGGSLLAGTLALVGMAFAMRGIMKLRSSGNIEIAKAVGKVADVYLTIPAKGNGSGKITLTLEERYVELSAISLSDTPIPTGEKVKITALIGDSLVVEKISN